MPAYGVNPAVLLNRGIPTQVWNNEVVAVGALSQSVSLPEMDNFPGFCAIELQFSGNPGTFEVDLMSATTDAQQFYCKRSSCAVVNGQFVGRIEVVNIVARYLALSMVALQNPGVSITATIL